MMYGVLMVPVVVGGKYQAAQDGADDPVGPAAGEKGSVPAVMKNNGNTRQAQINNPTTNKKATPLDKRCVNSINVSTL